MFPGISRNSLIVIAIMLATLALPEGIGSAAIPQGSQANDTLIGAKRRRFNQGAYSFQSSAWERTARSSASTLALESREAELRAFRSQAELGNE